MKQAAWWPKISFIFILALFATIGGNTAAHTSTQQFAKPTFCSGPEYRQFDFWLGDWDAFEAGKTAVVARTRVDRILDGCVLRENYESANGLKGQSLSLYDASRGIWHQSWATNKGQLLTIEGRLEDGAMVLAGAERSADGAERLVRGTWKPISGGVRETAVTSLDAGKTWQPWFNLVFRPHSSGDGVNSSANRNATIVSAHSDHDGHFAYQNWVHWSHSETWFFDYYVAHPTGHHIVDEHCWAANNYRADTVGTGDAHGGTGVLVNRGTPIWKVSN
jgi:hypothetical protein